MSLKFIYKYYYTSFMYKYYYILYVIKHQDLASIVFEFSVFIWFEKYNYYCKETDCKEHSIKFKRKACIWSMFAKNRIPYVAHFAALCNARKKLLYI